MPTLKRVLYYTIDDMRLSFELGKKPDVTLSEFDQLAMRRRQRNILKIIEPARAVGVKRSDI